MLDDVDLGNSEISCSQDRNYHCSSQYMMEKHSQMAAKVNFLEGKVQEIEDEFKRFKLATPSMSIDKIKHDDSKVDVTSVLYQIMKGKKTSLQYKFMRNIF